MKGKTAEDLYAQLERELRTPAERLLLDAFLPAPETIQSALYRPAPPAPVADPAAAAMFPGGERAVARDRDVEEEQAPRRKPRPRKTAEPQRSLEEEIQDFLNLRGTALAPDTDPEK
ncbi:MAG TPA: hypothetical protein VFC25_06200 [Verrucomicrobiae bacterium]|nr:hypothetical protein [Verrucomicrobiae bacterium]